MGDGEKKPFGWRPISDEYRQSLRDAGYDDEQIAKVEADNRYTPNRETVAALELARATLIVLARRHGEEFAAEVRAELERRRAKFEQSDEVEEQVEAPILGELLEGKMWGEMKG